MAVSTTVIACGQTIPDDFMERFGMRLFAIVGNGEYAGTFTVTVKLHLQKQIRAIILFS
jgi:hypothetical protein